MSIESTQTRRMSMANEVCPEKKYVTTLLPWLIAAAFFFFYLATRDPWQPLFGTQVAMIAAGWSPQLDLTRPLYWLVTLPLRLLPDSYVPLGLNVFTALCAGITLALLARSVALLPHDRTEAQRLREHSAFSLLTIRAAWVPPVLAVLALGLQLTFWQHGAGISTEIFDLLLIAYVIRCLLEFRMHGADSWLLRACFVYAAGMSNNWAMITFLPLFLVALIWFKGLSFFNAQFLTRAVFVASAGLCFYLLMPVVSALSADSPETFWSALKKVLGNQKNVLAFFFTNRSMLWAGERPLWVLALPTLVPVLAMGISWPSTFGDHSKLGIALANFTFNVLHVLFLCVCAWVLLDPEFSPRNYIPELSLPWLSFYFLAALSLGYYAGYFLLVFGGAKPFQRIPRPEPAWTPLLNRVVTTGVYGLLIVLPLFLVGFNWHSLRIEGSNFRKYAELKAKSVPGGTVVLADNPMDTLLVPYHWIQSGDRQKYVLLDSQSMTNAWYHRHLAKLHPGIWSPVPTGKDTFSDPELVDLLGKVSESRPVYYLHPSFGYYFERFYLQPAGGAYKLEHCGTNSVLRPPLPESIVRSNKEFWTNAEHELVGRLMDLRGESSNLIQPPAILKWAEGPLRSVAARIGVSRKPSNSVNEIASSLSRGLNYWGVRLQRAGRTSEAGAYFARSMELNPENFCADLNLQCNRNLLSGKPPEVPVTPEMGEKLTRHGALHNALNRDGPMDEPLGCSMVGSVFFAGGLFRQAAEEFKRAAEFRPDILQYRMALIQSLMMRSSHLEALDEIKDIHANSAALNISRTNAAPLLQAEMAAHIMNTNLTRAEEVMQTALAKYPGDASLMGVASSAYLEAGYSSNALNMLNQQLALRPKDQGALINLGLAYIRLTNYANALVPLNQVLAMGTNDSPEFYYYALWNHAIAQEGAGALDDAQKDYEELLKALPNAVDVYVNLGKLAERKKNVELAIRNYEILRDKLAEKKVPTNHPLFSNTVERLEALKKTER